MNCSPPTTRSPTGNPANRSPNTCRWLGVTFTSTSSTSDPTNPVATSPAATSISSRSATTTRPPAINGPNSAVTVKSNDTAEGNTDPPPPPPNPPTPSHHYFPHPPSVTP